MKVCSDPAQTVKRLKKIEGQIRGLVNMVESDQPCEQILIQLAAARAALRKTGQSLIENHLRHCVADGFKNGDFETATEDFLKALEQFSRQS